MIEIKKIKYPELNAIIRMYPNAEVLLGHEIFWQEKRDGSNLGVYLNDNDGLGARSRNKTKVSDDLCGAFNRTEEASKIKEMLLSMKYDWNDECVPFGEMLLKGKSPTRTELHDREEFVVFDIWSSKAGGFLPYMLVYQHCYHFDLPIVELYGTSKHTSVKSLLSFRDSMLEIAKENGREGVVGKTFEKNIKLHYFKEKSDTPKLEKKPRYIEEGTIILPQLPESEVLGALDKVFIDIGSKKFKDVKEAMPLFAKYVSEECRKHNCRRPERNLFRYYKEKLEEMEVGEK